MDIERQVNRPTRSWRVWGWLRQRDVSSHDTNDFTGPGAFGDFDFQGAARGDAEGSPIDSLTTDLLDTYRLTRHSKKGLESRPDGVESTGRVEVELGLESLEETARKVSAVDGIPELACQARSERAELLGEGLSVDVEIHADAQNREGDPGALGAAFHQDSGGFPLPDQHVIRPFDFDGFFIAEKFCDAG